MSKQVKELSGYTNTIASLKSLIYNNVVGKNMFNPADVIDGYYIQTSSGALTAHATSKISGLIPITPNEIYYVTRPNLSSGISVRFLKADQTTATKALNPSTGLAYTNYDLPLRSYAVKAPFDAAYFQMNVIFNNVGNINTTQFEKGIASTTYEAFGYRKEISFDNLPTEFNGLSTKVNVLRGKLITLNGDSICAGAGDAVGGYGKIIADRNAMAYENKSASGGTITGGTIFAEGGANRHWISRTIDQMAAAADYVILEGGINDGSLGVTLGEVTSGYEATLDDTTFCGALESTFKQSIARWPGKKIGFIIQHRILNDAHVYTTGFYPKIKEICEKWGIPYLDLVKEMPTLYFIDALKATYTYNGDGWHPNLLGYTKFYCDKIEAWMKAL